MKFTLGAATLFAASVSAHSWLGCTAHENEEILQWMKGNASLTPPVIIDPAMPWFNYLCKGWPRAKNNPGDWIEESTNYVWNIQAESFNGDTHACHPSQREPNYNDNAPMATAKPGDTLKLYFGGNGHTRGAVQGGKPGRVSVYWKGEPDEEIVDIEEFTEENKLQENGFDEASFSYPEGVTKPEEGLVDKGNWQNLQLPMAMNPGRHMFVWVWSYEDKPQWSTCFDVQVQ